MCWESGRHEGGALGPHSCTGSPACGGKASSLILHPSPFLQPSGLNGGKQQVLASARASLCQVGQTWGLPNAPSQGSTCGEADPEDISPFTSHLSPFHQASPPSKSCGGTGSSVPRSPSSHTDLFWFEQDQPLSLEPQVQVSVLRWRNKHTGWVLSAAREVQNQLQQPEEQILPQQRVPRNVAMVKGGGTGVAT